MLKPRWRNPPCRNIEVITARYTFLPGKQGGAVIAACRTRSGRLRTNVSRDLVDRQRATLRELAGDRGELEVEADLAVDAHRAPVDLHDVGAPQG